MNRFNFLNRSAILFPFFALCTFLIFTLSCDSVKNPFGFIVCSQLTSDLLQINIVSISQPMGAPTTLVAVAGHSAISPVVTPNGATMVFSANFENPTPSDSNPPGGSLYRINFTDGNYTRITDDSWMSIYEGSPAISPDGTTIVFVRTDAQIGPLEALSRLWLVQLDGSDKHPVFADENPRNDYAPAFSPDGKMLAYLSDNHTNIVNVMVYDLKAGGGPVQLTRYSSVDDTVFSPFFDASGQWIYFQLSRKSAYSLNRIGITGKKLEKVFDIPKVDMPNHSVYGAAGYFDFKPAKDFQHVVCTGGINDAYQVFTTDNLTSPFSPATVTAATSDYLYPFWYRP